jgi:hypothetical protein
MPPSPVGKEACMGDMVKYTDCSDGHATERITGKDDDDFVANVKRHLGMIH